MFPSLNFGHYQLMSNFVYFEVNFCCHIISSTQYLCIYVCIYIYVYTQHIHALYIYILNANYMSKSAHRCREGSDWAGVREFEQLMGCELGLEGLAEC